MSTLELSDSDDAWLEECIDELDATVEGLERYPEKVLLHALAAHVVGLAQALAETGSLSLAEFREALLAELTEREPET
jgi:hypothetical protein